MKKEDVLKFGNHSFPVNPVKITVSAKSDINYDCTLDNEVIITSKKPRPHTISGSGVFYGDDGIDNAEMLEDLSKDEKPNMLTAPGVYPTMAYLTSFDYDVDAVKNAVFYSFVFTSSCNRDSELDFGYTYAKENENAFDIASRCGVSVDDIMDFNSFKTPFDINNGDKVYLK